MKSKRPGMPCRKLWNVCRRERARMPLFRQLEFLFGQLATRVDVGKDGVEGQALRLPNSPAATAAVALQFRGRDVDLEQIARELLRARGASRLAKDLHA